MEFRQIEHFLKLYQLQNMTKASESLFISQQGLSRSIKNLEDELEISLFNKSQRGAFPTKAAEALKPYFDTLIKDRAQFLATVAKLHREEDRQQINVILPGSLTYSDLMITFHKFQEQYPNAEILWQHSSEAAAYDALQSGNSHFAFVQSPILPDFTDHGIVFKEDLCAFLSAEHSLASEYYFDLFKSVEQTLILEDETSPIYKNICFQLDQQQIISKKILSTGSLIEIIPDILQNKLIALGFPSIFQCFDPNRLRILPIKPTISGELHLISHSKTEHNTVEKQFATFFTK